MNWRLPRGVALRRLVFMPLFGLVGVGLILGAENSVAGGVGVLLLLIVAAGFAQAIVDFRRSGRHL